MKRLLTALVAVPLALAAVFLLPPAGFLMVVALVLGGAAFEFAALARHYAAGAPLAPLAPAALAACVGGGALGAGLLGAPGPLAGLALAAALALGPAVGILLARAPAAGTLPALGAYHFALPYFGLAAFGICALQARDPWWLFLLLAIVWLGDSAAYYVGSAWGRHRMAPVVSPNKTWEGAAAGLAIGLVATLIWTLARGRGLDLPLLAVAAATGVAAQIGDLVISLLKRGAGVKDTGSLLPGHGGMLDRFDAMLFAAPVLELGLRLTGHPGVAGG